MEKHETHVFQTSYVRSQVKSELFGIPRIPKLSHKMAPWKSLFKSRVNKHVGKTVRISNYISCCWENPNNQMIQYVIKSPLNKSSVLRLCLPRTVCGAPHVFLFSFFQFDSILDLIVFSWFFFCQQRHLQGVVTVRNIPPPATILGWLTIASLEYTSHDSIYPWRRFRKFRMGKPQVPIHSPNVDGSIIYRRIYIHFSNYKYIYMAFMICRCALLNPYFWRGGYVRRGAGWPAIA